MKKLLRSTFIIFCLQLLPAKAQWVTIPDANFVNYLTLNYPSCMNGNMMDTTCSQILNATDLTFWQSSILDFSGIEYFSNLIHLDISYHFDFINIPSLPPGLQELWCDNNSNLTVLPALPSSLLYLSCRNNFISSIPNLPSGIQGVHFSDNPLSNFPVLPPTVIGLSCAGLGLSALPALPPNLSQLDCSYNQLTYLPQLPQTITSLICNNNQLTSLPFLPNITDLNCGNNQLTSLPPIPNVMYSFSINNNNISCLNYIPQTTIIPNISNNPITCIPNQTNYSFGLPLCIENDTINNPYSCASLVNISGYVFTDQNSNCIYNGIDLGSANIQVKLFDSLNFLVAQNYTSDATYGFMVNQPGNYKVKIEYYNLPISIDCAQADSQIVNFTSISTGITNINFPIQCNAGSDVITQSLNTQGWVFPGQQHTLNTNITNNVSWYNLNCNSINYSGTVSLNITGPVSYVAPANNALTPTINGNTFTYNITDFNTLTPQSFGLKFQTDTTAQAGDQICVHVEIDPTPLDADTTNNVYDFCYQVLNSYDPNMKEVYPVNVLPGYDDWFTYTIHFQNTGNAPAFNIRLRDTLDANLDINTFEMLGYSHPAIVSINGNVLTVRFNNIMLPDSTSDYEGSMGYFQYRIKPLANLPLGTQIENTAYTYFDYNAPIITNTTQNNFQMVVSTINGNEDANQLKVFPNPAKEVITINLQNSSIENFIILNTLGQTVYNSAHEINANHKIQLNIADLSAGVYFVKVRSGSGSYIAKFIKAE